MSEIINKAFKAFVYLSGVQGFLLFLTYWICIGLANKGHEESKNKIASHVAFATSTICLFQSILAIFIIVAFIINTLF